jgi:uncharacterized protein (UPF0548 family)
MLRLRKPSDAVLQQVLEDRRALPFSYATVGATTAVATGAIDAALPAGFHHSRFEVDLGPDAGDRFTRAGNAVDQWVPQLGAGITVFPRTPVTADLAMVLAIPLPVAGWAIAPARVAYVVDEPDRAGFAYGTLPGHPEAGEEAFIVLRQGGRVWFRVVAFARPAALITRFGGPVARAFQARTIKAYLQAVKAATD